MKKVLFSLIFISLFSQISYSQSEMWIVGANSTYNIPLGNLANRMEANLGGIIYAGKKLNSGWTWVGKFEYLKLNKVNKDKMFKFVKSDVDGTPEDYKFDLPYLKMDLTVAGLSAEARYNLLTTSFIEANLNFGFGFYYWEHFRSGYQDSLFITSAGNNNPLLVEYLDVPPLRQKDWSGGINLGADINILIFDPVSLNFGFNYKIIIGELWPTLSLNLENVSGMQFFDVRAGFHVKL